MLVLQVQCYCIWTPPSQTWGGGGRRAGLCLVRKYSGQFTTNRCNQLVIQYPCVCIDSVRKIYRCDSCISRCDHPTCLMRSLCFRFSRLQVPSRISTCLWITEWLDSCFNEYFMFLLFNACYFLPVLCRPFFFFFFFFFLMIKLEFV